MAKRKNPKARNAQLAKAKSPGSLEGKERRSRLQSRLNDFVKSLSGVLVDITALEVNTMVVTRITGEKFSAWQAYRELYAIGTVDLERRQIHESLRDRYLELRRNLELDHALLVTNPNSELYDPAMMNAVEDRRILTDPSLDIDSNSTLLPDPLKPTTSADIVRVQELLNDSSFLRSLRKMGELKACLDCRNQAILTMAAAYPDSLPSAVANAVKTDMIYAQTIIQLDGDIINRYSEEILDHPQKDLILQIHKEGVEAGEKQWRGLLGFIVDIVQKALEKGANLGFLAFDRSR